MSDIALAFIWSHIWRNVQQQVLLSNNSEFIFFDIHGTHFLSYFNLSVAHLKLL